MMKNFETRGPPCAERRVPTKKCKHGFPEPSADIQLQICMGNITVNAQLMALPPIFPLRTKLYLGCQKIVYTF